MGADADGRERDMSEDKFSAKVKEIYIVAEDPDYIWKNVILVLENGEKYKFSADVFKVDLQREKP